MRITFVISHADLSGGMRVIATYVEQLHRRGHDVTVVSRPKRKPTLKETINHRILKKPLPWDARPVPKTHLDNTPAKHHVIDRYRPILATDLPDADVVVGTWWETMEWIMPLPASKGAKVHFMQDYETFGGTKDRVDAVCRLPVQRILIAQWVKDLMVREFNDTDAVIIPNAVDHELFFASPRGKAAVPTVGTTYTRFRNKGTDIALEAYRRAKQTIPELKLVAFGGGAIDPNLPIPAGADFFHGLPDEKLRDVYAACDAWLFATRVEAFGLPVLEAMACRTPVLATPAGAAPELVSGGGGMLVPMEDPAALADAIVRVARMGDGAWRTMSDAAYGTAARYTWPQSVEKFEAVLKRVRVPTPAGRRD